MKKEKIISICVIFLAATSIIFFSGCSKNKNAPAYQMNLEVWGFIDDSDAFREINQNYRSLNPQIKQIQYKKVSSNIEEFEKELLNAIASGKGPDMIFFHNSWLMEHKNKIASHPLSEKYLSQFNKKFIDVASSDFIEENKIYAMPLHSDTLALFYNKEIFNQEGLTKAPETWEDLAEYTRKITDLNQDGTFSRSAIALGRSSVPPGEINRASDIMNLLFLQNNIQMIDDRGMSTTFNRDVLSSSSLDFYTSFGKDSPLHTWNSKMEGSVDSFRFGKTAMMINYSYMANKLKSTDPKFNFGIAPVPQIDLDKKVNYSNYW
jgi:multiple sugar transport system substrate-binding protein